MGNYRKLDRGRDFFAALDHQKKVTQPEIGAKEVLEKRRLRYSSSQLCWNATSA